MEPSEKWTTNWTTLVQQQREPSRRGFETHRARRDAEWSQSTREITDTCYRVTRAQPASTISASALPYVCGGGGQ